MVLPKVGRTTPPNSITYQLTIVISPSPLSPPRVSLYLTAASNLPLSFLLYIAFGAITTLSMLSFELGTVPYNIADRLGVAKRFGRSVPIAPPSGANFH